MTDIDLTDAVGVVCALSADDLAREMRVAFMVTPTEHSWSMNLGDMNVALSAVARVVREQVARQIEARMDAADAQGSDDFSEGMWSGLNEARHVARGQS